VRRALGKVADGIDREQCVENSISISANGGVELSAARPHGGMSAPEARWRIEAECRTQRCDVMMIDDSGRITGVPTQGPSRVLTTQRSARDLPVSVECNRRERLPDATAVVEHALFGRFEDVKVDAAPGPVVQDEVPWTIVSPRIEAIDTDCDQGNDGPVEVVGGQPEVQVAVGSCLSTKVGIDAPAAPDADVDASLVEGVE